MMLIPHSPQKKTHKTFLVWTRPRDAGKTFTRSRRRSRRCFTTTTADVSDIFSRVVVRFHEIFTRSRISGSGLDTTKKMVLSLLQLYYHYGTGVGYSISICGQNFFFKIWLREFFKFWLREFLKFWLRNRAEKTICF